MSTREFLLSAWNWHPAAVTAAALTILAYAAVWNKTPKPEVRSPKSEGGPKSETRWQVCCLLTGVAIFLLVLVSPIEALADGYLFSAHMLQHLLLLLVVPPLLLLAWPAQTNKLAMGSRPKAFALRPLLGWLAGAGAMWLWHAPALCNAAASSQGIRSIQVISLLVLGGMFWWPILGPRLDQRIAPLTGAMYLFTACVACTLLGIIITFAPVSVCSVYLHPVDRLGILPLIQEGWRISPAVDQQVGGLLMWVPACAIYVCGIMALLARWYAGAESEPEAPQSASTRPARP